MTFCGKKMVISGGRINQKEFPDNDGNEDKDQSENSVDPSSAVAAEGLISIVNSLSDW